MLQTRPQKPDFNVNARPLKLKLLKTPEIATSKFSKLKLPRFIKCKLKIFKYANNL